MHLGSTAVHSELLAADGADSSVNQAQVVAFSAIWLKEFPVKLKQSPEARGSVKGSRNSVTGTGVDPKERGG